MFAPKKTPFEVRWMETGLYDLGLIRSESNEALTAVPLMSSRTEGITPSAVVLWPGAIFNILQVRRISK